MFRLFKFSFPHRPRRDDLYINPSARPIKPMWFIVNRSRAFGVVRRTRPLEHPVWHTRITHSHTRAYNVYIILIRHGPPTDRLSSIRVRTARIGRRRAHHKYSLTRSNNANNTIYYNNFIKIPTTTAALYMRSYTPRLVPIIYTYYWDVRRRGAGI